MSRMNDSCSSQPGNRRKGTAYISRGRALAVWSQVSLSGRTRSLKWPLVGFGAGQSAIRHLPTVTYDASYWIEMSPSEWEVGSNGDETHRNNLGPREPTQ